MGFWQGGPSGQIPGVSVGLFRMIFGLLWLDMARQKAPWVIQDGHRFGWLYGWIWQEINHPTLEIYKTFLQTVVLPHFTLFGYLTFFTEVALGLSLLMGLFTVLGGLAGALWQLNIALGSFSVPGEWYWTWFLLIAPHLIFAYTRAGRSVGIDQLLSRRERARPALGQYLLRFV